MRTSSSLLLSVLTIAVIVFSTIASIVLFGNALIANAQSSQLITSQPGTPQGEERTFQSISDSFSVLVPEGWIIQDVNNTGFRLLAEVLQGYGVLAQLCPQEQQGQQALSNVTGGSTSTGSCQASQGGENIIHIIRYPNLGARPGFASNDISTTNNITADDILAYQIQKLQEVGYRDIYIVNNTDTTVNVDTSAAATNNNNTLSEATVPAKFVEMTYTTDSAPNETRTGYFISTVTNVTPRNLGMITGYSIFYEGNSAASDSASPAAETSTPSGSLPLRLPAAVRQVFDSFKLIAAAEVEQATQAEQQEQPTNPLTVEIISNDTEDVAPATFEFEANIMDGTEPNIISWDFDDGTEESDEENVVHTFDEAGTYNVNLTITDSLDQIASDSIEISVEEPPAEEGTSAATTDTTTTTDNDNNNVPSTDATNGNENNNEEVVVRIPQGASELTDDAYSPNPVEVRVGDTVTWINDDSTSHTATSGTPDSGSTGVFGGTDDSPEIIEPEGGTQSYTFDEAGEFPYYCTIHPNMVGTVIVTGE
jgi:plastocyanin